MEIIKIANSFFEENTYLIKFDNEGYLLDPGNEFKTILKRIPPDFKMLGILLTHGHLDHIASVNQLVKHLDVPVYLSQEDLPYARGEIKLMEFHNYVTSEIKDCIFDLNDPRIEVISTPGHSAGSVCYYVKSLNALFSGDTIFENGVGRTDLPLGSSKALKSSIEKLFKLDKNTKIYPGHGRTTTIEAEKKRGSSIFW